MAPVARALRVPALALALLVAPALTVVVPAASAADLECFGKAPTIVGTADSEVIEGTAGPDVIVGLGGRDIITGLGGDDALCGGDGDDVLVGGRGNDELAGEGHLSPDGEPEFPLGDLLAGGPGDDVIRGGADAGDDDTRGDVVSFEDAARPVDVDLTAGTSTGEGDDQISGVDGLIGSEHGDTLRGIRYGEVHAGGGADRVVTVPGAETLMGGMGPDVLVLGKGDHGWGDDGQDVFRMRDVGGATASGDQGNDRYVGGPGSDTCTAERRRGCEG